MFLLLLSVISIIVAMIRKGNFANILDCGIRAWYLFVISLVIFLAVKVGDTMQVAFIQSYAKFFVLGAYALILVGAIFNLSNLWMIPLLGGALCNFVVIFMNSGKMPLSTSALSIAGITAATVGESSVLSVASSSTSLPFLGGIIPVPLPGILAEVISIGTVLIGIGLFFIIQNVLLGIVYEYEYEDDEDYDDEYDDEYDEDDNMEDTLPIFAQSEDKSFVIENDIDSDFASDKDYTLDDKLVDELSVVENDIVAGLDDFILESDLNEDVMPTENVDKKEDNDISIFDDEIVLDDEAVVETSEITSDTDFEFNFDDDIHTQIEEPIVDNAGFEDLFGDLKAEIFTAEEATTVGADISFDIAEDMNISEENSDDAVIASDTENQVETAATEIDNDFDFTVDSIESSDVLEKSSEEVISETMDDIGDFDLLSGFEDLFEGETFDFDDVFAEDVHSEVEDTDENVEDESEENSHIESAVEDVLTDTASEDLSLDSTDENVFDLDEFSIGEDAVDVVDDVIENIDDVIAPESDEVELSDDVEIDLSDIDFASMFDTESNENVVDEITDVQDISSEEPKIDMELDEIVEENNIVDAVKTMEDISDVDYTDDVLIDAEFELQPMSEEIEDQSDEIVEEPEPVDVDSPFIIVNGRIVENPNYKFRKGIDYYETERIAASRVAEPVAEVKKEIDTLDFNEDSDSVTVSELAPNGFEKVEMKIGDVQIKFWKRDND